MYYGANTPSLHSSTMSLSLMCFDCLHTFATKSSLKRHLTKTKKECETDSYWDATTHQDYYIPRKRQNLSQEEKRRRKSLRNRVYYWTKV
jgi:hypothetical protein